MGCGASVEDGDTKKRRHCCEGCGLVALSRGDVRRRENGARLCMKCLRKSIRAEAVETSSESTVDPRPRGICAMCGRDRCLHRENSSRHLCATCWMKGSSSQSSTSLCCASQDGCISPLRRKCNAFAAFTAQGQLHYSGKHEHKKKTHFATPIETASSLARTLSRTWSSSSWAAAASIPQSKKAAWPELDAVADPLERQMHELKPRRSGGSACRARQNSGAERKSRSRSWAAGLSHTKYGFLSKTRSSRVEPVDARVATPSRGTPLPLELPPLLPGLDDLEKRTGCPPPPPLPQLGPSCGMLPAVSVGPTFRTLTELNMVRCS